VSFITDRICVSCGRSVSDPQAFTCPACGPDEGILDVHHDVAAVARSLTPAALVERPRSIWRYRELLPIQTEPPAALASVGWTPLMDSPRLAAALGIGKLRLKDDGRSMSGSFKDRASAVGVAHAIENGCSAIACASTGNAASSLACCSAATGLQANIFVSQIVPAGKLAQMLAYGARVFKVQGTYADAYNLCRQSCERFGWYNRNCAINPYLVEGKKTAGLELSEQCAHDPPDWVVCSVGDGCSIAGVWKGLAQMHAIGHIDWQPRMLGVQAAGVAPISKAYETGQLDCPSLGDTYADSINVPVPRNWRKATTAVRNSHGKFVTVSDDEIREAVRLIGRLAGIFAEPAAAAAIAGIAEARGRNLITAEASVVAMITGNGLKDIAGAMRALTGPFEIPPDIDQVERVVADDRHTPNGGTR
jgi:threonine synthase